MDFNKEQLENIYQGIKDKRKQQDEHIKIVLSYIHESLFFKNEVDYNTLITHCCNKLNGNLDGLEINLKERKNKNDSR